MTTGHSPLGPTRTRVLRVLREAGTPVSAAEVAERLGVHANSARFHLDALAEAGMVERGAEGRSSPGRPKVLYAVSAALPAEDGGWRELATILTRALADPTPSPARAAEVAGEAHGRVLAAGLQHESAPTQVAAVLGRLGFESSARPTQAGARIDIRPCPFLDLARSHGEVVCGVHRGLLTGMLDTLDPSLALERLEPFARPDLCVARIRRA